MCYPNSLQFFICDSVNNLPVCRMACGIEVPEDCLLHAERLAGCIPEFKQAGTVTKTAKLRQGGDVEIPLARAVVECPTNFIGLICRTFYLHQISVCRSCT